MALERFANWTAATTLNGAITNVATSLVVTSATGWPTLPQFRLRIDDELIVVGGVSGTTFSSLTRGAEGTAAAAHANGASVRPVLTAAGLALESAQGHELPSNGYYLFNWSETTTGPQLELLTAAPIWLPMCVVDRIGVTVTSESASGNGVLRVGLYDDAGFDFPGAKLLEQTLNVTAIGPSQNTISQTISRPGRYWVAAVAQVVGDFAFPVFEPGQGIHSMITTSAPPEFVDDYIKPAPCVAGVTGALPDPFGSPPFTRHIDSPCVYMRVAA
jgi:hypothetical protein